MKIIENAVPRPLFEFAKLETDFLHWGFLNVTHNNSPSSDNPQEYSFAIDQVTDGVQSHGQAYLWVSIFYCLLERFDISYDDLEDLIRIRMGLITNVGDQYIHGAHIDYERPHYTMLLYLDTINEGGETTFYNEMRNLKYKDQDQQLDHETLTVKETLKAVENRCVIFNGHQFHSSSTPIKQASRRAVNFNFTLKKGLTPLAD